MNKNYLDVANSGWLWLASIPVIFIVLWQVALFIRKTLRAGDIVGLSRPDAGRAFRVGAVSAIGPAFGVFVVMVGLMSQIGGPISWMRLAIIGSAPAELAAATSAAKAMNVELGGKDYQVIHFAAATWVMALNGSGWLLVTAFFTPNLNAISNKISKGNPKLLGIIAASAMCGAMSFLFGSEIIKVMQPNKKGVPFFVAGIASAISMVVLERLAVKMPKLKEYSLGFAMIIGMAAGALTKAAL